MAKQATVQKTNESSDLLPEACFSHSNQRCDCPLCCAAVGSISNYERCLKENFKRQIADMMGVWDTSSWGDGAPMGLDFPCILLAPGFDFSQRGHYAKRKTKASGDHAAKNGSRYNVTRKHTEKLKAAQQSFENADQETPAAMGWDYFSVNWAGQIQANKGLVFPPMLFFTAEQLPIVVECPVCGKLFQVSCLPTGHKVNTL